jgi:chain length determinant protein (polysaccharide antigen chain regulator)
MNTEQQYNDEIDLADLVRSLWNGKWLVIGITLATVIAATVYVVVTPKSYTGTLYITTIPISETNKYLPLSVAIEAIEASEASEASEFPRSVLESDLNNITKDQLALLFIEDVQTYAGLKKSIEEKKYFKKLENESNVEFTRRMEAVARTFTLSKVVNKKGEGDSKWLMEVTTQQPGLAIGVLADALLFSNNRVSHSVENTFNEILNAKSRNITGKINDINIAKNILIAQEKLKTQARLAFLNEQANLARAIKISKNTLNAQAFTTQSSLVSIIDQRQPYYLRGYTAIETEIDNLSSRQSPELFIPKLLDLDRQRQTLLQDKSIARLKEALKLTPIGTDAFKSAAYDLYTVQFKSTSKPKLVLTLSLVLGGMLGIFVLVIRNVVSRKEQP